MNERQAEAILAWKDGPSQGNPERLAEIAGIPVALAKQALDMAHIRASGLIPWQRLEPVVLDKIIHAVEQ